MTEKRESCNQSCSNLRGSVVFALCGSFCTFETVLPQIERLCNLRWNVIPVVSYSAATQDTRFGCAAEWRGRLEQLTGHRPIDTLQGVEPLGPKGLADAMIVAPCTGVTLSRLAFGLSDTPVTLAAKSLLRNGAPIVVAPSTNDGLSGSAPAIAALLQRKHFYFVPFGQDDCRAKPCSLKSDFTRIPDTLEHALRGEQLQPVLF